MNINCVHSHFSLLKNRKTIVVLTVAFVVSAVFSFNFTSAVTGQLYPQETVPAGLFDSCDATSNGYGNWGCSSSMNSVSIGTSSPAQGTGYVNCVLSSSVYAEWIWKRSTGDFWDLSQCPILTFQIRTSVPAPQWGFHGKLYVATATGTSLWESGSVLLPTVPVAGKWTTEVIDLRTINYSDSNGPINLRLIRSFEIYVENRYSEMTVDIDNLQLSAAPDQAVTPMSTPMSTPNPNLSIYCSFTVNNFATVVPPVYKESLISLPIQGSYISSDGTLYAGSGSTLYKSFDQGINWEQLLTFNGSSNLEITCVFVNRLNYVFASPTAAADQNELGLWRSTDDGLSWSKVLALPQDCNIWPLAQDSNGSMFAGVYTAGGTTSNARIYRSTDNGGTWDTVFYDPQARHIHDISIDPENDYIYATIGDTISQWQSSYVIRSTDGGNTWHEILAGLPQILSIEAIPGARLLSTDQSFPGHGIIYRTTDDLTCQIVCDIGAPGYGYWIRVNDLNGDLYASFMSTETTTFAGIFFSNDSGVTWRLYKSFDVQTVQWMYRGSGTASNFLGGTMYYSQLLDYGYENGVKIYPDYNTSSGPLIMKTSALQTNAAKQPTHENTAQIGGLTVCFGNFQWVPLSLGFTFISTAFFLKNLLKKSNLSRKTKGIKVTVS